MDPVSNVVNVSLFDNPSQAPNYQGDTTMLKMHTCIVVGKGTVEGNPTVDLQMVDDSGNKYLVMTTGAIMEMIHGAVAGKRKQGMQ